MVRTRIAPSPTGSPHIGTAWQALFDYVFAKKNKGKFIFRLEDTDRQRYVKESIEQIKETFEWLGFTYDEGPDIGGPFGPYVQSERLDIYKTHAGNLVRKKLAYEDNGAIRFTFNKEGKTTYHDLIGDKDITIDNSSQEDFVLLKSDGFPTYNFANVVDDHLMEISHVIRGNEYISSMPKYLQLYKAFGWSTPQFAHLPLLLGSDREKLSKRNGAKSTLEFRDEGFLKDAVVNFLSLLGWTHPQGKELFSLEELLSVFDFKDFNESSAYFDVKKLEWMNGEYIRKSQISNLKSQIKEYLKIRNISVHDEFIDKFLPLAQTRMKTLNEFYELVSPFVQEKSFELTPKEKDIAKTLVQMFFNMEKWNEESILSAMKKTLEEKKCKMGVLYKIFTGKESGLPLPQALEIIGKEKALELLNYSSPNT